MALAASLTGVGCSGSTHVRSQTTSPSPSGTPRAGDAAIVRTVHDVDWRRAIIPAAACGTKRTVALKDGFGGERDESPTAGIQFANLGQPIRYIDLGDDGTDEAAVPIDCVGPHTRSVVVIFTLRRSNLAVLGILITTQPNPPGQQPFIDNTATTYTADRIEAVEMWYGPSDGSFCCPSIEARTTWTYQGGAIHQGPTTTAPRALPHVTPRDFVRAWHIHGGQLNVNSVHDAIDKERVGVCDGSGACYLETHLALSASADGTVLTATVVAETYLSGNDAPVPRPPNTRSALGDTYRFELPYPGILREIPVRVPDRHSPDDDAYFCGPDLHPWQIAYTCN